MSKYEFKIPLLPKSVNSAYQINYNHRVVFLSPEARTFKYQAKMYMPPMKVQDSVKISLDIDYHSDWYYKNGKLKREDIQNFDKLLIDTIFEHIGIDDSNLWELHTKKVQDKDRFITIVLQEGDSSLCTHTT